MDFVGWLYQQLDDRDWSQADLVKHARQKGYSITPAQISRILNREQKAGVNAVIAISHALELPREELFRVRGWLLSEASQIVDSDVDPRVAQIAKDLSQLPTEVRHATLNTITALLEALRTVNNSKRKE